MPQERNPLDLMVRKLQQHIELGEADQQALLALPCQLRVLEPSAYLVREGEPPRQCAMLVSGYAFRQKLTREGTRQITSLHLPGDALDLQHLLLDFADHNVQMLTRAELAIVPRAAWRELVMTRPVIGLAVQIDNLIEASVAREWILNLGRRNARARVAHLLCEFGARLDAQGLSDGDGYELPMTQEQLGDALGLTSVHINRTLRTLEGEGLITRNRRYISFARDGGLRGVADFNPRYLHLGRQEEAGAALGATLARD